MANRGDVLGDFELHEILGQGGYGVVWRARQMSTDRVVALKLMKHQSDAEATRRFLREGALLRRLQHPCCVEFIDAGRLDQGVLYIATALSDGEPLDEWLSKPRSIESIISVASQLVDCLAHAHREGVAHRDLKPANILVEAGPKITLLDFGIAKLLGLRRADITKTGVVIGTAGYMSPEQLRGASDVGVETDQYSLGVILFEALSGRPPFTADSPLEIAMAHLSVPPPALPPSVPRWLAVIVRRLLAKKPNERFPSMGHVARALRGEHVEPREQSAQSPKLDTRVAGIVAVVVLLCVGVAVWALNRDADADEVRKAGIAVATPAWQSPPVPTTIAEPERTETCDPDAKRGHFEIGQKSLLAYVPVDFRADEAGPAILLFSSGEEVLREKLITELGLSAFADDWNAIVLAPNGRSDNPIMKGRRWDDHLVDAAWRDTLAVMEQFCMADSPIVAVGERDGGPVADLLAARYPRRVRAVALTGSRYDDQLGVRNEFGLKEPRPRVPARPVPRLDIHFRQDGTHPWNGGERCNSNGYVVWSVERQDRLWQGFHGCDDEGSTPLEFEDGVCHEWSNCDVPLTSCHVEGGRQWSTGGYPQRCESDPSRFPHTDVLRAFFARHLDLAHAPDSDN